MSVSRGGSGSQQDAVFGGSEDGYRGPTACHAAGITYRQLDYWARTGLVEPSVRAAQGSGSQRLYSFRDILVLKVVKRLLDTGISLQQIRAAVQHLRDRGTEDLAQVTLMSDGVSVYECTSPDEVVDLLAGGQGVFGIALGRVWQEVAGELAELPAVREEDGLITADTDELGARRRARKTGLRLLLATAAAPRGCGLTTGFGWCGWRTVGKLLGSQLSRLGETPPPAHVLGCGAPKGQHIPGTSQAPGPGGTGASGAIRRQTGSRPGEGSLGAGIFH